jgi:hypothetical protein
MKAVAAYRAKLERRFLSGSKKDSQFPDAIIVWLSANTGGEVDLKKEQSRQAFGISVQNCLVWHQTFLRQACGVIHA